MTATGGSGGLVLDRVQLRLRGRHLLGPLDLAVPAGTVVTVMGPSGSGKSSLLSHICGTLGPAFSASGRMIIGGQDVAGVPPERRRVGILFQDDLLFPHMTVAENLAFSLPRDIQGRERRDRVEAALADAELAGFGSRDPATLSEGQRARVALMRTLLAEPEVLLLDEPFGRLDAGLRARIRAFVFDHARRRGLPTLLVTHDQEDAAAAGGPVVQLQQSVATMS